MVDFNEARSLLTADHVRAWALANFPMPFRALPRAARLTWVDLDDSFTYSRSIERALSRSTHTQALVVGTYAPGKDISQERTDCVVAFVHPEEAEDRFYRVTQTADGTDELQPVKSTSAVAFHSPFCDVGEDTGGSKAIHRVSALIHYYFLAAGHVKELLRTKSDPTMFSRNFRDACSWVHNGGDRPTAPISRRASIATATPSDTVAAPSKPSSTSSNYSTRFRSPTDTHCAPPTRSATDNTKLKRERLDTSPPRPRKNPRRTLSEQIHIPKLLGHESTMSPRSPERVINPERVIKAQSDRIQSLKDESTEIRQRMTQAAREHQVQREQWKKELTGVEAKLANIEKASQDLRAEVEALKAILIR